MLKRLLITLSLSIVWWPAGAVGQPQAFEIAARHKHFVGGSDGTLVINKDGIEFRGVPHESYQWRYLELRKIQILSPTRLTVDTFAKPISQSHMHYGPGPSYSFETASPLPLGAVQLLLANYSRPIVSAVMPPLSAPAIVRVAVKQHRDEGELALYDEGLAYVTPDEQESRFWRFRDIASVLKLDRDRLQVTAYEGEPGQTHTFIFELKTDLPTEMYDRIWQRVNAPGRGSSEIDR